jgi:hypothetical protein
MKSRVIYPILIGAVVAEGVGVGLFLVTAHLIVTGLSSPLMLLATLAVLGGSVGGLSSLIWHRQ